MIYEKYQKIEIIKKLDKIDAYKKEIFVANDNKAIKIEKINKLVK